MMGGTSFMVFVLVVTILVVSAVMLFLDLEEVQAYGLLVLGISVLGIAGQMLHLDVFEHTLPLVNMARLPGLLLLGASVTVSGLWITIAVSPVFERMKGETGDDLAGSMGNDMWLMGLGLALLSCVALAIGCAIAVRTNADVINWIADHLPDQITGISPDVAFTVASVDISFSLADVTHGLIVGWIVALATLLAGGLMLLAGLIPALIGDQVFSSAIEKRQRSLFGPPIAVLYVAACLILLIVPPLSA